MPQFFDMVICRSRCVDYTKNRDMFSFIHTTVTEKIDSTYAFNLNYSSVAQFLKLTFFVLVPFPFFPAAYFFQKNYN